MARQDGTATNARKKSKKLNYFYLRGQLEPGGPQVPLLHKSLHINRGADRIIAWCYPLGKRVAYTYSDVKKHKEPAFTTKETCAMLNRSRRTIEGILADGYIEKPQHTYGLNAERRMFKYMWHENDIMAAHAHLTTVHKGRPRLDGMATPQSLPTVRELRALIRQEQLLYVQNDSGEFVPVWKAPDFT